MQLSESQSQYDNQDLRVIAVSAPHWVSNGGQVVAHSLDVGDAFSLYNAIRKAATNAVNGTGAWGRSNWATFEGRSNSVLLMRYFNEEIQRFVRTLITVRPNLLLIGSMTLSFPGAVRLAQIAKDILGEEVFVVLGGKHVIETVFQARDGAVVHHRGSPVLLMKEGKITKCFDLVVSGDGEDVIAAIGELVASHAGCVNGRRHLFDELEQRASNIGGKWIACHVDDGSVRSIAGEQGCIDLQGVLPYPALFGVRSSFDIFDADVTIHAHSGMSRGCVYNCSFCSERSDVNGPLSRIQESPAYLGRQFLAARDYGARRLRSIKSSIFVEDSILLSGIDNALEKFCYILDANEINIPFGCQFTIDNILNPKKRAIMARLARYGLKYVFIGVETVKEDIARGMSKNLSRSSHAASWQQKVENALKELSLIGVRCGISVLFGLGESELDREYMLQQILQLKQTYGEPTVISANIATQHPLRGCDGGMNYDYLEWGTPEESEYLPLFVDTYGEASLRYPIRPDAVLSLAEVKHIQNIMIDINRADAMKWQKVA